MKKEDYHFELNPFVQIVKDKFEMVDSKSENFELEYKYAFLKHTKDNYAFKSSETSSLVRPIILNATKYQNKHKINAGCDKEYYRNAQKNLKNISEIKDIDPIQRHMLYMNNGDQKFLYDCKYSQWMRVDKEKLLRRQFDAIYKKKLFRLDLSHKIFEEKKILDKIMAMLETRKKNVGILRYKHSFIYEVHQFWNISCSTVYQTQNEEDFLGIKKLLAEFKEDIADQIKKTIEQNEKKLRNKFQLQLIFTQEGIDFLKVASESDAKSLISKAFNIFQELTNDSQVEQLQKLFEGLQLEQKQKKNHQKKSQLQSQEKIVSKKIQKAQKNEEKQDFIFVVPNSKK